MIRSLSGNLLLKDFTYEQLLLRLVLMRFSLLCYAPESCFKIDRDSIAKRLIPPTRPLVQIDLIDGAVPLSEIGTFSKGFSLILYTFRHLSTEDI